MFFVEPFYSINCKRFPKGYLDFYIRTKNIRRAPFYILSVNMVALMRTIVFLMRMMMIILQVGNAVLMIVVMML